MYQLNFTNKNSSVLPVAVTHFSPSVRPTCRKRRPMGHERTGTNVIILMLFTVTDLYVLSTLRWPFNNLIIVLFAFLISCLTIFLSLMCHKAVGRSVNQIQQSINSQTHFLLACSAYDIIRNQYFNICSLQKPFGNTPYKTTCCEFH